MKGSTSNTQSAVNLSDEGRKFLREQANELVQNNQYCTLVTYGPNTSYNGLIDSVEDGGIVFAEAGTGRTISAPWETVEKLIGLPQTASGEQADHASAGS